MTVSRSVTIRSPRRAGIRRCRPVPPCARVRGGRLNRIQEPLPRFVDFGQRQRELYAVFDLKRAKAFVMRRLQTANEHVQRIVGERNEKAPHERVVVSKVHDGIAVHDDLPVLGDNDWETIIDLVEE